MVKSFLFIPIIKTDYGSILPPTGQDGESLLWPSLVQLVAEVAG
jgi:hypothetical protein